MCRCSRRADDGVPVHELQVLAGHASIMTTQRYMNARASRGRESTSVPDLIEHTHKLPRCTGA
jgi:integrase